MFSATGAPRLPRPIKPISIIFFLVFTKEERGYKLIACDCSDDDPYPLWSHLSPCYYSTFLINFDFSSCFINVDVYDWLNFFKVSGLNTFDWTDHIISSDATSYKLL